MNTRLAWNYSRHARNGILSQRTSSTSGVELAGRTATNRVHHHQQQHPWYLPITLTSRAPHAENLSFSGENTLIYFLLRGVAIIYDAYSMLSKQMFRISCLLNQLSIDKNTPWKHFNGQLRTSFSSSFKRKSFLGSAGRVCQFVVGVRWIQRRDLTVMKCRQKRRCGTHVLPQNTCR